jgi:predicted phage gp36 major capsid-like protein
MTSVFTQVENDNRNEVVNDDDEEEAIKAEMERMMEEARKQAEVKLRAAKVKKIRKDITTLRDKLKSKVINILLVIVLKE